MFLFLSIILLTSCDGTSSKSYIIATDYLEGDSLKINIKLEKAFPFPGKYVSAFTDSISIQDLSAYVDNSDTDDYDLSVETYQDRYILINKVEKDTGKLRYYILSVYGLKEFFCPIASLNNNNKKFDIYMPYHLLVDVKYQTVPKDDYFNISNPFKSAGTIDDFYTFYNLLDTYTVEQLEDKLVVEDTYTNTKFYITFSYREEGSYYKKTVTYVKYSLK